MQHHSTWPYTEHLQKTWNIFEKYSSSYF